MPAKPKPSNDPTERQRQYILAREAHEAALDQIVLDRHAGRVPAIGQGALDVLARRVNETRAALEEMTVTS